jgi:hypothetical protein
MDFHFEARDGYLYFRAAGSFDPQRGRAGVAKIYALCREHGLVKVLIDARGLSNLVTISQRHDLATYLADLRDSPVRIAVLVPTFLMYTKMLEDTALNRGTPVRTTDSVADACAWLDIPNVGPWVPIPRSKAE